MLSENQSESTPTKLEPSRKKKTLKTTGAVLLVLFVVAWCVKDLPQTRVGILRVLDNIYSKGLAERPTNVDFGPPSDKSQIQSLENKSGVAPESVLVKPLALEFGHEWLESPKVKVFRNSLPFKVTSEQSVFELSEQVRSLTSHGKSSLSGTPTDPLEYLNYAKTNEPLTCRYFAVIYGAVARLAGYTTRLVALSKHGTMRDHAVCEVYVPEYSKWILIDPDFNIAYKKNGQFLNAKELSHEWSRIRDQILKESKKAKHKGLQEFVKSIMQVEVVELGPSSAELRNSNMYQGSFTGANLEFFEYVLFSNRNDYLSAEYPFGHPIRTREYLLKASPDLPTPAVCPEAVLLSNIDDIYWPVGRSQIAVTNAVNSPKKTLNLKFSTWTPNFLAFEFRAENKPWTTLKKNTMQWAPANAQNKLEIRSINTAGLPGEVCVLTVPPFFQK